MKKGYTRTEAMLRRESSNIDKDGKPIIDRSLEPLPGRFREAFILLAKWLDGNLDVYKVRLLNQEIAPMKTFISCSHPLSLN